MMTRKETTQQVQKKQRKETEVNEAAEGCDNGYFSSMVAPMVRWLMFRVLAWVEVVGGHKALICLHAKVMRWVGGWEYGE